MAKSLTFNELRRLKAELPEGTIQKIANKLDLNVETVRNYFGGTDFDQGEATGFHYEQGPDGGIVTIDDPKILDMAVQIILEEKQIEQREGMALNDFLSLMKVNFNVHAAKMAREEKAQD